MTIEPPLYTELIAFWRDAGPAKWFAKDEAFDDALRERFEALHFAAARGELNHWAEAPESALALVLLLDQVPRNIFRGSAHAYATDPLARAVARTAIEKGFHLEADPALRIFFFMPLEHSEHVADQDRCVDLFERHAKETGDLESLKWARLHQEIIESFGRFPHRNDCLGRETTEAERRFLEEGGFSG